MARSRNGMMSGAPNLVQALRPGFVNTAMDPGIAEYQTPAAGNDKMPYDPQAAAKFKAAIQKNMAQRPQMGQQQTPDVLQQFGQPLPQDMKMIRDVTAGPGASMPQFVRNQGMRNPPFYNPPPGQNMQMQGGMGQNMIDNNAQGSIQDFLAGGGQGGVPPEAYQNYSQQPQQQQAQPQKGGANAGRVRQSPGVYKDPRTGALYGNNGKLMRAGTGRMR